MNDQGKQRGQSGRNEKHTSVIPRLLDLLVVPDFGQPLFI